MDTQQILLRMNFGRVDGETDTRFENCFIGTEMLRQTLMPQHSLIIGSKGAGKSAMARLLCNDLAKVRPLMPREYDSIFCVPAYGLQTEEYLSGLDIRELKPESPDEFRTFWLLYIALKSASVLVQEKRAQELVARSKNMQVKDVFEDLRLLMVDLGLIPKEKGMLDKLRDKVVRRSRAKYKGDDTGGVTFKQFAGRSIIGLLEDLDLILREINCLSWIVLDKLDLLFIEDFEKLKGAITGLIQLLVQYGHQFTNIHFKILLRNDIYRQLHIVNKSHLVSFSTEMKWRGPLLLRMLVSRAVVEPSVKEYCEQVIGEPIDVSNVILNDDAYVKKIFYAIFEPTMSASGGAHATPTHQWILKRLVDGLGNSFPREIIHLGNLAVEVQREINRSEGKHTSARLISSRAVKEAFVRMSAYRCETYLYAEFPHLTKHFDIFRGSESPSFHREELYMLFQPLSPNGDEAIRSVHDVGLLIPVGKNVDSCSEFKVPLLYRAGLGIMDRRPKPPEPKREENAVQAKIVNIEVVRH